MVVKLISKGEPPKKAKCHNCGATCSYLNADIQERHGKDYGGGPDGAKWITCAGCNEKIVLESW